MSISIVSRRRAEPSIFYKIQVVSIADKLGDDNFFLEGGEYLVFPKANLKKWRKQVKSFEFPMTEKRSRVDWYTDQDGKDTEETIRLLIKGQLNSINNVGSIANRAVPLFKKYTRCFDRNNFTNDELELLYRELLVNRHGTLTRFGRANVLHNYDLETQCKKLNIELQTIKMCSEGDKDDRPGYERIERVMLAYYKNLYGGDWFYTENVIYDIICEVLIRPLVNSLGSYTGHRYLMHNVIANNMEDEFEKNFTEEYFLQKVHEIKLEGICSTHLGLIISDSQVGDPNLCGQDICILLTLLGYNVVARIVQFELEEPNRFSRGWPDLIHMQDGWLRFVEVKRLGDRLTVGQIENLPFFREIGLQIDVVQVA